ncbi:MAG TPA: nucleotidyltransferase domain-containing protein [Xanthomonadaceae bacterium]|nr:nucleotidyltransferase domain-containing protein [Xanthomonadaceae bacterium]
MKPLIHHLLGETRTAILAALLLRPDEARHVRDLERSTGLSPGSLHRELTALVALEILQREQVGRQVFYRANPGCPVLPELTGLLRKTAGLVDVLREALSPLADRIDGAFVYGSMARGTPHAHSDVDLMVVGSVGFADVALAMEPAQRVIGREINPTILSRDAFFQRRAQPDSFVATIWKEPKLWLTGGLDEPG